MASPSPDMKMNCGRGSKAYVFVCSRASAILQGQYLSKDSCRPAKSGLNRYAYRLLSPLSYKKMSHLQGPIRCVAQI